MLENNYIVQIVDLVDYNPGMGVIHHRIVGATKKCEKSMLCKWSHCSVRAAPPIQQEYINDDAVL